MTRAYGRARQGLRKPFSSFDADEELLRRIGNRSRIASIGGKAVILGRLARGGSDVGWICSVWCEWVRRVVRLGRRWGHRIHIDAFAIGPRSGRVLRGRDAGAQKQCRESER